MDFGGGDEVRFERSGKAGVITLTRPQALNALTGRMIRAISHALTEWEADAGVAAVVVRGEGRAFCAGGDLMVVHGHRNDPPFAFFAEEYRLNAQIARFPKPYVALIDGIVMGGGVGVSFHGSHRVMTENALFAMPEVGIGFFPDVGASHLLPRLRGDFGLYLGLTGARIRWGDALWCGLATHAVAKDGLDAVLRGVAAAGRPDEALRSVASTPSAESSEEKLAAIDRWFGGKTLAEVLARLEAEEEDDPPAAEMLAMIRQKAPTSLAVAFRAIRDGRHMAMDDCMRMEFRIVCRMLLGHDFYEGIRAAIIEKGSQPAWRPAALPDVTEAAVDAHFAPLGKDELTL
ncbi:MAG: enoyl-CoA hydratase/isomerase family protein [Rhizobiales bacterium]|nr:enoyl-CoA hydratase/isomerase family protein [Hyphomicrobiales bacterium]